jgi:predicted dehydrogenase
VKTPPVVSLIGSGGVGSRHLQAILKLPGPLRIQVVERDRAAVENARLRAAEVALASDATIDWHETLEGLVPADLTIVATLAPGRADLISRLLDLSNRRFLLEKVVFQSEEEFSRILEAFAQQGAKGWVNCPRRYYPFYHQLHNDLRGTAPVILQVSAGNRGLGCNAIHYVDLFEYLTGRMPVSIDGALLSEAVQRNRRDAELVEFSGTLSGVTPEHDTIEITFAPVPQPTALVSIASRWISAFADEAADFALRSGSGKDNRWREIEFGYRHVSDVTTSIAADILNTDDCRLATLARSANMHNLLFDAFNSHLERDTGRRPLLCPIT